MFRALRSDLQAATAKYLVERQVIEVLKLTHAQEMLTYPRNEWPLVRQKQVEEIRAVSAGKPFDIVDRRSWSFPYLPECLSECSTLLTKDGFKGDKEITLDDEVATLNLETGELEYFKPKRIIRRHYKGKMFHFEGRGFDCLVTPNHRMVGQWKWINYAQGKGRYRKPGHWEGFKDRFEPHEVRGRCGLSKLGFAEASAVGNYLGQYKCKEYGFEVPFGAKWVGKFPKFYNPRTGKIRISVVTIKMVQSVGKQNRNCMHRLR